MKLYLVQHGDSVSKEVDPERPLSGQGRNDVTRIAARLGAAGVVTERVLHSGKLRAQQTAEILANKLLSKDNNIETIAGISPNDPVENFVSVLSEWQDDTIVVGHLPFMSRCVAYLLTGDTEKPIVEYQPGSVVCLSGIDQGQWLLQWMIRPALATE